MLRSMDAWASVAGKFDNGGGPLLLLDVKWRTDDGGDDGDDAYYFDTWTCSHCKARNEINDLRDA